MSELTSTQARRNIKIQQWINFLAGVTFLTPVITLLYKHTGLNLMEITLIANVATLATWLLELPTSVFADVSGRRRSLIYGVIANFLGAILLLFFPTFYGFIGASLCAAFYWSFWSGTGQAFLEENLRISGEEKYFGKVISRFMFVEQAAGLVCPLVAGALLFFSPERGYQLLAAFDVFSAFLLVYLTTQLQESPKMVKTTSSFREAIDAYSATTRAALFSVFTKKEIRFLLYYRTFANHVAYLPLVIFPVLMDLHMPAYAAGMIAPLATLMMMLMLHYSSSISSRWSWSHTWIIATCTQAFLLFIAAFCLQQWWLLALVYILFVGCDGLWQPAWNQVLVQVVRGKAIATTRSLIFACFAFYTTLGKQILSFLPLNYAFFLLACVICVANILLARKITSLEQVEETE